MAVANGMGSQVQAIWLCEVGTLSGWVMLGNQHLDWSWDSMATCKPGTTIDVLHMSLIGEMQASGKPIQIGKNHSCLQIAAFCQAGALSLSVIFQLSISLYFCSLKSQV